MKEFIAVYTTLPKRRKARQLAKSLINERLAACANIFKIDSVYRWQGELQDAGEYGLLLKTRVDLYPRIEERIRELHPYELPAIVSFTIRNGSQEFLDWIASETADTA
jgi:periplasmic divalent cation tolerance protein